MMNNSHSSMMNNYMNNNMNNNMSNTMNIINSCINNINNNLFRIVTAYNYLSDNIESLYKMKNVNLTSINLINNMINQNIEQINQINSNNNMINMLLNNLSLSQNIKDKEKQIFKPKTNEIHYLFKEITGNKIIINFKTPEKNITCFVPDTIRIKDLLFGFFKEFELDKKDLENRFVFLFNDTKLNSLDESNIIDYGLRQGSSIIVIDNNFDLIKTYSNLNYK